MVYRKALRVLLLTVVASVCANQVWSQIEYELLTSTTEVSGSGSGYALNTFWEDCRTESVYLASDLNAAGISGSVPFSAIALKISEVPGRSVDNIRIRLKHTTSTTLNGAYQTGYTVVYGPTTLAASTFSVNGWYTFAFSQPWVWNGTDNVLVDYSNDGTAWTSGGGVFQRNVGSARQTYGSADSNFTYDFAGMEDGTRTTVPSIKITVDGLSIITPSTLPSGAEQTSYSTDIQASQGTPGYTWSTVSSNLPSTLSLTQQGQIYRLAGTPASGTSGNYSVTVRVTDTVNDSYDKTMSIYIAPQPANMPFTDDFSATNTNWNLTGGWQSSTAIAYTQSASTTGPARSEPGSDTSPTSDNRILGHSIGADYTNNMAVQTATAPPVNCVGATNVQLRFQRWLGVSSIDLAKIEITNNGSTWNDVWTSGGASVNTPNAWVASAYDITQWAAGNAVVQVRFVLGPTDASIINVGWCIDDFEILDPGPALEVTEGPTPVNTITDDQAVGGLRDYGQVNTGTNSQTVDFTLTNNGTSVITIPTYTKVGADPAKFIVVQAPSSTIPIGGSTVLSVLFNSNGGGTGGAGVYTATIELPHNATGAGVGTTPFEINLRAEAITPQPIITVTEPGGTPVITHGMAAAGTYRDFGNVNVGSASAPITIEVTNTGNTDLGISLIDMGGTNWTEFQVNTAAWTFVQQVAPQQTLSFEVTFNPTSPGAKTAIVRISHNDTSQGTGYPTYEIPVMGNAIGTNPALEVVEGTAGPTLTHDQTVGSARDFGNVQVGTTSNPLIITINNPGGAQLDVTNIVLGGPDAAEFGLNVAGFTSPIAPNGSSSFEITFAPTSAGQKVAWVELTHNDTAVTSPFRINITGNGVTTAPGLAVRESSATGNQITSSAAAAGILDFGNQDIGAGPTASAVIFIQNTGTAPMTVGLPVFNPATTEYQITATGFPATIAAGANATFSIVFDPTTVGVHGASIQFTHNDTTQPSPFVLNLTGTGVLNAPLIEVREASTTGTQVASGTPATLGGGRDTGSIDVSAGATAPITIVILNTGTLDLNLGNPTLTGTNAADFVLNTAGGIFNNVVTPGNSTQIEVMFDPSLGGIKEAQVEFTQDDTTQASPFIVPVIGTAIDPNGVQISTTTLAPGATGTPYGPEQFTAIQGSPAYTWSLYSGTLPAGLTLSPTGQLSGTPGGLGGSYNFMVRVTDQTGATHERSFNLVVTGLYTGRGKASSGGSCSAEGGNAGIGLMALLGLLGICALSGRHARERRV